jgi:hypothetical protein
MIDMLIYLLKNGYKMCKNAYRYAAKYGHFHIVKYLYENDYKDPNNEACSGASKGGQ